MIIEESNLIFEFPEENLTAKFDDTFFYKRKYGKMPGGKGIDIISCAGDGIQLIEIKNCKGYESDNLWRTSTDNRMIHTAPRNLDVTDRESLDIEVAKKVSSTISCLYGAWTLSERQENARDLEELWSRMVSGKIPKDRLNIVVILFLEGNFNPKPTVSRTKRTMMKRIQESLSTKLTWLNCRVMVVDSDTYKERYFKVRA